MYETGTDSPGNKRIGMERTGKRTGIPAGFRLDAYLPGPAEVAHPYWTMEGLSRMTDSGTNAV